MSNRLGSTEQIVNVLVLQKGEHYWIFVYRDEARTQLLRQFGRMAMDEKLKFSWYDSAVLSARAKKAALDNGNHAEQWESNF